LIDPAENRNCKVMNIFHSTVLFLRTVRRAIIYQNFVEVFFGGGEGKRGGTCAFRLLPARVSPSLLPQARCGFGAVSLPGLPPPSPPAQGLRLLYGVSCWYLQNCWATTSFSACTRFAVAFSLLLGFHITTNCWVSRAATTYSACTEFAVALRCLVGICRTTDLLGFQSCYLLLLLHRIRSCF
jgi:hypothetical protein